LNAFPFKRGQNFDGKQGALGFFQMVNDFHSVELGHKYSPMDLKKEKSILLACPIRFHCAEFPTFAVLWK
jgi:hypothetical protein